MTKCWDMASMALLPLIGLAMYAVLISLLQEKLIYMPRSYDGTHREYYKKQRQQASSTLIGLGGSKVINLKYTLNDGTPQIAYFLAPPALRRNQKIRRKKKNNPAHTAIDIDGDIDGDGDGDKVKAAEALPSSPPFQLWMAASGNAGLALDWLDTSVHFIQQNNRRTRTHGFLLVDYPGYGSNGGAPSPATILETSNLALARLDRHLSKKYPRQTDYTVSYVAHSIGCSAVMQHAVSLVQKGIHGGKSSKNVRVKNIVLVSPFTTMIDMAGLALPLPIPGVQYLLRHGWDNLRSMKELGELLLLDDGSDDAASLSEPMTLTIIHGDADQIVPVDMGRKVHSIAKEMAALVKKKYQGKKMLKVYYHEIRHGDHNRILGHAEDVIFKAMRR